VNEREGLIGRIRQIRRAHAAAEEPAKTPATGLTHDELRALGARIDHLEQLVQGLQDSVHREASRNEKRVADLETQIQPAALVKALSDDARARGL
jgi:hypothetical protein